jgi:hypothetical protein
MTWSDIAQVFALAQATNSGYCIVRGLLAAQRRKHMEGWG